MAARPPLPPTPLQRARQAAGLSQARLARETGVHPATISLAERSGSVSRGLAERLARALGVTPDDLLQKSEGR